MAHTYNPNIQADAEGSNVQAHAGQLMTQGEPVPK